MKVKECMNPNIQQVHGANTICEVAKIMSENHIGSVVVCDEQKNVVGIVTDRDIILRSLACDNYDKSTPINEIMTTNVVTADVTDDVNSVMNCMSKNQVRRIPVTENNKAVGVVSLGDLVQCQNISEKDTTETLGCICGNNHGENKNAE